MRDVRPRQTAPEPCGPQRGVIYMPGATDMYFPITDAEYELQFIPDVEFLSIPSLWGHMAGAGPNEADRAFIIEAIRSVLR